MNARSVAETLLETHTLADLLRWAVAVDSIETPAPSSRRFAAEEAGTVRPGGAS